MKFRVLLILLELLSPVVIANLWLNCEAHAAGPLDLRLQVASGDQPEGLGELSSFDSILAGDINDTGTIAFSANVITPSPQGLSVRWGLFVREGPQIRKVLLEGDTLPGGEKFGVLRSKSLPVFEINNNVAIAIADAERILLYQSGFLRWVARAGFLAPGTTASFSSFEVRPTDFLNGKGEIAFKAVLSDSTNGVFLASDSGIQKVAIEGESIPDRTGRRFQLSTLRLSSPLLAKTSLVFSSVSTTTSQNGVFVFSQSNLSTLAMGGDSMPGITGTVNGIGTFDLNDRGEVAFAVRDTTNAESNAHLFLWSNGSFQRIAGRGLALPGFLGQNANFFSELSLDNKGRLFFAAQVMSERSGFFLWEQGELQKIVIDGEPTPVGGTYRLGWLPVVLSVPATHPLPLGSQPFFFTVTDMNDARQVAFQAEAVGSTLGSVIFVWKAGLVEVIPTRDVKDPQIGDRLVSFLSPLQLNQTGSLLLKGFLCCGAFETALYTAGPARARVQYLPLIAGGQDRSLAYGTQILLANKSQFPGLVFLDAFDTQGNPLPTGLPASFVLEAGQTRDLGFGLARLTSGYLRMQVEGGADVSLSGILRLFRNNQLESQTGLAAVEPLQAGSLIVEKNASANTGLAISNPQSASNRIRLVLRDAQNRLAFEKVLTLAPGQQLTLFINDLFSDLPVADFLGALHLVGESPFLLAGMRLAGLQMTTLPVDSIESRFRPWGFVNVFSSLFDFLGQAQMNSRGDVAAVTGLERQKIELLDVHSSVTAVDSDTPFPEGLKIRSGQSGPVILGLNARKEILFAVNLEAGFGLFLWSGGTVRKIATQGEKLPDGSEVKLGRDPSSLIGLTTLNDAGLVAFAGSESLYLHDGSLKTLFRVFDLIPGDPGTRWGSPSSLDLTDDGRLVFATNTLLGIHQNGKSTALLKTGDRVSDRGFLLTRFTRAEITKTGTIFFTAEEFAGQIRSGLFVLEGNTVRTALLTGERITGHPGTLTGIGTIGSVLPRFQVNDNDLALVQGRFAVEDQANPIADAFLLVNRRAEVQILLRQRFRIDNFLFGRGIFFSRFHWNNSNQLMFIGTLQTAPDRPSRGALFVWENGKVQKVLATGERWSMPTAPLAVVSILSPSWGLSDSGRLLFVASAEGEGTPTTGLFLGIPENFQQYLIPQLVDGQVAEVRFESTLLLHNKDTRPSTVTVDLMGSSGPVVRDWKTVSLQPGEIQVIPIEAPKPLVGWAAVQVTGGETAVFERMSLFQGSQLLSEVTIPSTHPADEGFWQTTVTGAGDTGIAIANPYSQTAIVVIEQLGRNLESQSRATLAIPPRGKRAVLLKELFPSGLWTTLLRFKSPLPVSVITLRLDGTRITSLPVSIDP